MATTDELVRKAVRRLLLNNAIKLAEIISPANCPRLEVWESATNDDVELVLNNERYMVHVRKVR